MSRTEYKYRITDADGNQRALMVILANSSCDADRKVMERASKIDGLGDCTIQQISGPRQIQLNG